MIALGSVVKDSITGCTGVATGATTWMNGCVRYCVEPAELKDGRPIEGIWFDEQRLLVIQAAAAAVAEARGGPQADPHGAVNDPSH